MITLIAYIAGLLFGLGLLISGLGNPEKVLNFLDFFGQWDPSLLLVMVAAIGSSSLAFAWAKRRSSSLLKEPMHWPASNAIDRKLLSGAALFGVGWGLTGLCPGPALMNLATLQIEVYWFVAAMVLGMLLAHRYTQQRTQANR
ncbi:hypothetical protein E8K88_07475 [Lampropedia aestuarii]|uniref:YeeE/YedE family protein n=1 Tax=Lampropedia aestuarii TaxID=2562762 RepID=A0A4S5BRS4_9BURK|nr:DUF6691 family protein [Lampropedia aestuarii]THJ33933.1 hypothetical protein E8K88_07475 [Lampropedia aestuarii]